MTAPTAPETPAAAAPAAPASPAPSRTAEVITAARARLAEGKSLLPAEAPAASTEQPTGAEPPPEGEAPKFTVTLPGMEERGEAALELEAPDQETYDRLNRLQNEATVGREVRQEQRGVADLRRQRAELEDMLAGDPAGFVLEHVPEHVRADIAMQLFFEPGVLEAIQQQLGQGEDGRSLVDLLEDPDQLRTLRAELKASRLEMRGRLSEQHEAGKAMQANAREVIAEIDRLIPAYLTGEQRERVLGDAVRDIRDRAHRLGLTQLDPADVRPLIEQRLRALGPMTARRSSAPAPAAASRPARPAVPGGALPKTSEERIKLARKIGLRAVIEQARGT